MKKIWNWMWKHINRIVTLILILGSLILHVITIKLISKPYILENYGFRVYEYKNEFGILTAKRFKINSKEYIEVEYNTYFLEHNYGTECYITFGNNEGITCDEVFKLEMKPYVDINQVGNNDNTFYYCELPMEVELYENVYIAIKKKDSENTVYSYKWVVVSGFKENLEIVK